MHGDLTAYRIGCALEWPKAFVEVCLAELKRQGRAKIVGHERRGRRINQVFAATSRNADAHSASGNSGIKAGPIEIGAGFRWGSTRLG